MAPSPQLSKTLIEPSWPMRFPFCFAQLSGKFPEKILVNHVSLFLDQMRQAVRDVAKYFPTAIVSGRCRAKVHFLHCQSVFWFSIFIYIYIYIVYQLIDGFLGWLWMLQVYNFVRLSQLYYAGSHGMDIKGPGKGGKSRKVSSICQNLFLFSLVIIPFCSPRS